MQVSITESENAVPGERVRAVGMCFYGCGTDLTKDRTYKLWHNTDNPKDDMCIEIKERYQVKATLNAKTSRLLAPLMDNGTVWETAWYDNYSFLFLFYCLRYAGYDISTEFNSSFLES